jgi:putative membrane protein
MKFVYALLFAVIFFIALLFSLKNLQLVTINLVMGTIQMPLALALTLELLAGILLGLAVRFLYVFRLKTECGKLQARLEVAELEIESLRAAVAEKDN